MTLTSVSPIIFHKMFLLFCCKKYFWLGEWDRRTQKKASKADNEVGEEKRLQLFDRKKLLQQYYILQQSSAFSGLNCQNFSLKKFILFFLKKFDLEKFITFSQKKGFLIFPGMEPCIFQPKLEKQNNPPGEHFLRFRKRKR